MSFCYRSALVAITNLNKI